MTDFSQPTRRRFLGAAAAGVGALAGIGVSGKALSAEGRTTDKVRLTWGLSGLNLIAKERGEFEKLLANEGISQAIRVPPASPTECTFSRMSTNYSADLATRVEPCIFGGNPDCSHCGCAISSGLHWFKDFRLGGVVKVEHIARTSVAISSTIGRLRKGYSTHERWTAKRGAGLVQIGQSEPPPTKEA